MQKEFEGVFPIYVLDWKYLVAMPYYSRYTYRHRAHDNAFQLLAGGGKIFGK